MSSAYGAGASTEILTVLGILAAVFALVVLVSVLVDRHAALLAERERRLELEHLLAHAHLAQRRGQVKSHFLFNVLNTIARLIELGRHAEAGKTVLALASLLRQGFKAQEHLTTLHEELKVVESYIAIQRIRFGDRVSVSVDVTPEAESAAIPPLTLQPLVENAFTHGVEPKPGPTEIAITGTINSGCVTITVCDNGVGIRLEIAVTVQNWRQNAAAGTVKGPGWSLQTIHHLLQAQFGDGAGLSVTPRAEGGTIAQMTFPYWPGEGHDRDSDLGG